MRKDKDLWALRDLEIPSRETTEASSLKPSQNIRSRESLSLADWGEDSEFWHEWQSEFDGQDKSLPVVKKTSTEIDPASSAIVQHSDDSDLHLDPWASQLAIHERRLEKEGTVDYGVPFRRQELLVEKTKEFARILQVTFRKHIEIFNQSRKSAAHAIHIYKISRSDEDFLIYRNGIKLIVSAQRAGRITLSFNQFIAPLAQTDSHAHVELEASWGAFDQLHWTYKNERVQLLDVVRYFLSELAFQSFK